MNTNQNLRKMKKQSKVKFNILYVGKLLTLAIIVMLLSSCQKEPTDPQKPIINDVPKGVFVLNEGLFNMNNASLTFYNYDNSTAVTDFFDLKNGRKLGDSGNDIAIYGSKLYIVVTNSSQVEVVDANTGKSVKQISFFDGETPRQPRNIAFHGSKAFVCSFDGTLAVIDTASLSIEKFTTVGRNPDGIAVANNKVYVSNSGGLDYPNYDNTVSVVDIASFKEIKKIEVGLNPYSVQTDMQGNVYVVTRGNYGDVPMRLHIIDSQSDEVTHTFDKDISSFAINDNWAYAYYADWMSGQTSNIFVIDLNTKEIVNNNFITDNIEIDAYSIYVNADNGNVFVSDVSGYTGNGRVYCFSKEGKLKYDFEAGMIPGSIAFK